MIYQSVFLWMISLQVCASSAVVLVLSLTLSHPLSVNGEDFSVHPPATTLVFPSGSVSNGDSQCVEICITDDDIYEENELFSVSIESVTLSLPVVIGTITLTLLDHIGLLYSKQDCM